MTAIHSTNNDYYVNSMIGNDENDGMSQGKAWKTLGKVNEIVFEPGDRIFFGGGISTGVRLGKTGRKTSGRLSERYERQWLRGRLIGRTT